MGETFALLSVAPFAGLYLSPTRRRAYEQWIERLEEEPGGASPYSEAFERTGIDRRDFFDAARAAYDECTAHQDYQLGRFIERLKARGEWENTLLIVAGSSFRGRRAGRPRSRAARDLRSLGYIR